MIGRSRSFARQSRYQARIEEGEEKDTDPGCMPSRVEKDFVRVVHYIRFSNQYFRTIWNYPRSYDADTTSVWCDHTGLALSYVRYDEPTQYRT